VLKLHLSGPFAILEINRTIVDALKNSQHFRARACRDQQTAARTIALNEPGMARIDLEDRELSI